VFSTSVGWIETQKKHQGHLKSIFRRPSLSFLSKQYWRRYGWKLVGYQQCFSAMEQNSQLKLDLQNSYKGNVYEKNK
jgi:hypothetical protein